MTEKTTSEKAKTAADKTVADNTEAKEPSTYAVFASSGRQFRVQEGDKVVVNRLELEKGSKVTFNEVNLIKLGDGPAKIGTPFVAGAKVTASVIRDFREKKLIIFKKHRRHGFTKKQGHRQDVTELRIESISA